MKAVEIDSYGGSEVLVYRDVMDPVPGPGEVVADIYAASVNPVDWKVRNGERQASLHLKFPHVLGVDFSGVVRAVGDGVTEFSIGDEVYGTTAQDQRGCYAEALAVPANQLALKPKGMSHKEAAAIALVGLTALVSLDDVAGLKSGETILVHAAAGGVGGFAVQYAKHVGARVYATASAPNHDYVKSLGADVVIDYRNQDFTEIAKDCDVVYETVGGDVQARSVSVLKPGGRLVYITKPPEGFVPPEHIEYLRPKVPRDGGHMRVISNLIDQGAVWAPEITEMPLNQIKKAHELSATEHVRGKIVMAVR
ncbi:MAG: NADP-dependent oxidoreductase [Rhodospirillaceae bacterium]|jgi:NADPH:quinone reductase-like Zn-dependent oxidoreductase|nr:NADP-dependent oxidoreductase [Rhodospirillaceae bacterium]